MKKNDGIFFGFAALLIAAMVTLAGCPDTLGNPRTVTYTGTSTGTTVTLKIIENTSRAAYTPQVEDEYELTVGIQASKGAVTSFSAGVFTLKPSNSQTTFTATISGGGLSALSGTITWTDGAASPGLGTVTPSNPNPDPGGETLPEPPSSTGTNEVGGKTYQTYDDKWEFSADGTYRYFDEEDGVWIEEENGTYSWDSSGAFKMVTLAPQRAVVEGSTLYDKAGWKAAARSYFVADGLTEANAAEETDGHYTTITAFIDAYADYTFALRLCNYTMSGETIGTFGEMGTYGYADAKGGKVVVKNDTASTLTVKTYAGYAGTEATAIVSAGARKQVFESGDDTFLMKTNIATSGRITEVEIEEGYFGDDRSSPDFGGARSSYETGPICVGGGRTITITVE
ncbi:MAG: hypothetical protein LBF74_01165 [Treponema sp.]|jgi:hypothetical protein|nr:hypothetical protein [Treponema sp.]